MFPLEMPSLDGSTGWLNSEPLSPADLQGRAVLVNFWTLTCINWLRQVPYVRAWSRTYRDDGLIVIGVHTPEFSFEHDIDRVRQAVSERGIDYPIVLDNDYTIWRAFDNHYWPALYFVDTDGVIRDDRFGEGGYEESEGTIQQLLRVDRPLVRVEGRGAEAAADWDHLRTPEIYLGFERSTGFVLPGGAAFNTSRSYELTGRISLNRWALAGQWTVGPEHALLDRPGGSIAIRFHARDAHLVLSSRARQPIPFRILIGAQPPGRSHGIDVDEDGHGVLRNSRMYQLVRQHGIVRELTLEITFLQPGAEAYSFTFG